MVICSLQNSIGTKGCTWHHSMGVKQHGWDFTFHAKCCTEHSYSSKVHHSCLKMLLISLLLLYQQILCYTFQLTLGISSILLSPMFNAGLQYGPTE